MARLSRTGSRIQGFRRIAAGEAARRQDTQEGLWFGDGPGAGVVPSSDLRMAAISTRVADEINMTCFTPPLGGAGWPGTHRSVYQLVTVARACTISLVEMGFMYPPAQPYPGVWNWAQVSIYANDGVAGTPLTLLGRCVPIPLAALSTDDCIDFVLPLWVPITVTAGQSIWIGVSPKAYSGPAEPVWTDEHGAYYIDARGTRTVGDLDFIKSRFSEPDPITGLGAHGPDWEDYDDKHLWVRLYEHPEALALQHTQAAPPPTSRVGIRSIIARPVEGELESACAAGIRPGMGTLPWDLAGGSGRAGGGGGATGNVNAPLPLVANEVVYATGPSTVDSNAGFTFDALTGIAYATALQTAQNLGIPGDPDLVQLAANALTVNGDVILNTPGFTGLTIRRDAGSVGGASLKLINDDAAGSWEVAIGNDEAFYLFNSDPAVRFSVQQDGDAMIAGDLIVDGGDIGITADTDLVQLTLGEVTVAGDVILTSMASGGAAVVGTYGWAHDGAYCAYLSRSGQDTWRLVLTVTGDDGLKFQNVTDGDIDVLALLDSGDVQVANDLLPKVAGGSNIGSPTKELGNVYIGSDKYHYFGSGQEASIHYDNADSRLEIRG